MKKAKQGAVPVPKKNLWKQIAKHWEFYVLLLPGIILTIIFKYVPMYGVQIAFRDYNPVGGFFGSPWVGLKWFERFFNNYNSMRMIKNTVLLSLYSILWTFPIPIILALLINQVKWKKFQCFADDTLCTSFYFNNDPVWYASYFPFSIWRTDQYNHSGIRRKSN